MVLYWEQNETVGVLLKQRLIGLDRLNVESSLGDLNGLLCNGLGHGRVDDGGRHGGVLLAGSVKVELLDRRVVHLEVLERGSSLFRSIVSYFPH
jgi:hypothetical protein